MQQLVSHHCPWGFSTEVNILLMDGWGIVPGTMYVKHSPNKSLRPGESVECETYYAVVVEHQDVL